MIANAALVDEVNVDTVHFRAEVREPVYLVFLTAPIEGS